MKKKLKDDNDFDNDLLHKQKFYKNKTYQTFNISKFKIITKAKLKSNTNTYNIKSNNIK